MMKASEAIKAKRKKEEGFVNHAYLDPPGNTVGKRSIGYGHQIRPNEKALLTKTITEAEASLLFDADSRDVEAAINRSLKRPVSQGQFDSLYEFAYNCGTGAMDRIAQVWNATGDSVLVTDHIKAYNHITVNGVKKESKNLTNLRAYEAGLWLGTVNLDQKKNG